MRYFHQTLLLIEFILISARLMQIHIFLGVSGQSDGFLQLDLDGVSSVDITAGIEILLEKIHYRIQV